MSPAHKQIICTLFDHRYLPRGLCMIDSVRKHGGNQPIWVLCLSRECESVLRKLDLPDVHTLSLSDLEKHIPELAAAKTNRGLLEYYFTCMAALHRFIFDTVPDAGYTMYVDADIAFFASPDLVFEAMRDAPVALTPHNFPPALREKYTKFGLYNAGWSAFQRTPEGMKCLDWWLARSIEWCHDYIDGDRYANQGYMMHFAEIAPHTLIFTQKGFNCAPWNIGGYKLSEQNGQIFVDGDRLVFFHFHGLKPYYRFFYFDCHRDYGASLPGLVRNRMYKPYLRDMLRHEDRVRALLAAGEESRSVALPRAKGSGTARSLRVWFQHQKPAIAGLVRRSLDLATGRPLLVWRGRVF